MRSRAAGATRHLPSGRAAVRLASRGERRALRAVRPARPVGPGASAIERLVARLPLLLPLLGLALLLQVALGERERPALLWAALPTALALVAYLRAGRARRRGPARGEAG